MKKMIGLALSCLIVLSSTAAVYGAEYTDIKSNHWAYEAVKAVSDQAIIKGYPDKSFKPNHTVTYGEFIKMALIAGSGEDAGNAASGHWAANYYYKALDLEYFSSWDIDKSQLGSPIPRGDMALIISSVLGDYDIDNYDEIQNGIQDVTYQTRHEYDIIKSYAAGVLTGYTDSTFRPDKTLSRAESAAVIHRLVDASKRILPVVVVEAATAGAITSGSAVTYPTSGLLDMSKLTPEKTVAVSVHFTDRYELYTDASEWDMKLYRAWDGSLGAFDHTMKGFIYLIKKGEIIEYCATTPMFNLNNEYLGFQRSAFHCDISTIDYIICVPSNAKSEGEDRIIAVVNPFKL